MRTEEQDLKDGYIYKLEEANKHLNHKNLEISEELEACRNSYVS